MLLSKCCLNLYSTAKTTWRLEVLGIVELCLRGVWGDGETSIPFLGLMFGGHVRSWHWRFLGATAPTQECILPDALSCMIPEVTHRLSQIFHSILKHEYAYQNRER